MPELVAILNAKQDQDHENRRFLAALQGVDLDKSSSRGADKWEEIKAEAFSGGHTKNPNDVMTLRGTNAKRKGFGIGMGLEATIIDADGKVTNIG